MNQLHICLNKTCLLERVCDNHRHLLQHLQQKCQTIDLNKFRQRILSSVDDIQYSQIENMPQYVSIQGNIKQLIQQVKVNLTEFEASYDKQKIYNHRLINEHFDAIYPHNLLLNILNRIRNKQEITDHKQLSTFVDYYLLNFQIDSQQEIKLNQLASNILNYTMTQRIDFVAQLEKSIQIERQVSIVQQILFEQNLAQININAGIKDPIIEQNNLIQKPLEQQQQQFVVIPQNIPAVKKKNSKTKRILEYDFEISSPQIEYGPNKEVYLRDPKHLLMFAPGFQSQEKVALYVKINFNTHEHMQFKMGVLVTDDYDIETRRGIYCLDQDGQLSNQEEIGLKNKNLKVTKENNLIVMNSNPKRLFIQVDRQRKAEKIQYNFQNSKSLRFFIQGCDLSVKIMEKL